MAYRPRPHARSDLPRCPDARHALQRCARRVGIHGYRRPAAAAESTSTSASNRSGRSPKSAAAPRLRPGGRAAGALLATTAWWKEERHGVFIDYNQNARDRTVASAYSVRPTPNAQVSCPLEWDEVPRGARRFHHRDGAEALRRNRRPRREHRRQGAFTGATSPAHRETRSRRPR
ncbi:hypothetical protein [Candidatus Amarobacter glycogenicus]|uniref:non-homologous end-joining DNA ligase LigD n=1 Tax=Candidatus Amarobacter glycogenicus TaxID=3140699 RepID=UPI0031CC4DCD